MRIWIASTLFLVKLECVGKLNRRCSSGGLKEDNCGRMYYSVSNWVGDVCLVDLVCVGGSPCHLLYSLWLKMKDETRNTGYCFKSCHWIVTMSLDKLKYTLGLLFRLSLECG